MTCKRVVLPYRCAAMFVYHLALLSKARPKYRENKQRSHTVPEIWRALDKAQLDTNVTPGGGVSSSVTSRP